MIIKTLSYLTKPHYANVHAKVKIDTCIIYYDCYPLMSLLEKCYNHINLI